MVQRFHADEICEEEIGEDGDLFSGGIYFDDFWIQCIWRQDLEYDTFVLPLKVI